MEWISLLFAGLFEIVWAVGIKYSNNFTKLTPSIITIIAMILSIVLLSISMKTIPLGTAYAIWTGIGAVGSVIAGIILFGESTELLRLLCVSLIIIGVIGLKIFTPK